MHLHPTQINEDEKVHAASGRIYGRHMDSPWVFGLNQGNDCRYFWVEQRDKATLLPIFERECAPCLVINSDKWLAYTGTSHQWVTNTIW